MLILSTECLYCCYNLSLTHIYTSSILSPIERVEGRREGGMKEKEGGKGGGRDERRKGVMKDGRERKRVREKKGRI